MFQSEPEQHYNISSVITPQTALPVIGSADFVKITDLSIDYKEPANGFHTDTKRYFFITQNNQLYTDGETIQISKLANLSDIFDMDTLDITATVKILHPDALGEAELLELQDDSNIMNNRRFVKDTTYFFDKGKYKITSFSSLDLFSAENTSYVGLFRDNDIPETVFLPFTDGQYAYTILIRAADLYFENILFDAKSLEMYDDENKLNIGQSFLSVSNGPRSSPPYDFADGFVMRNCIIANVGNSNDSLLNPSRKNAAISIVASTGQIHFEQLRILNCKAKAGYGIILADSSSNMYFKNLIIDMSSVYVGALGYTFAVKIEQDETLIQAKKGAYKHQVRAVFAQDLQIISNKIPFTKGIYIKDYGFHGFCVPKNFHFVNYRCENGDDHIPAAVITNVAAQPPEQFCLYDLNEHAWMISQNFRLTIEDQFKEIADTLHTMKKIRNQFKLHDVKFKICASTLKGFKLTSFSIDEETPALHICAVKDLNDSCLSPDLIPVAKESVFWFTKENDVFLYHFDFHSMAHYTMQKAVYGIPALHPPYKDPFDGTGIIGYPDYENYGIAILCRIKNANPEMFRCCCFTSLLKEIEIEGNLELLELTVGETASISAIPTVSDNSYTICECIDYDIDNTADDETIHWFTAKETSLIDLEYTNHTAAITAKEAGMITLIAKAMDHYNQGEIEKPFALIDIRIKDPDATAT